MFQNIYFTAWNANGQTIGRCSEKGGSFLLHNTKIMILLNVSCDTSNKTSLHPSQIGNAEILILILHPMNPFSEALRMPTELKNLFFISELRSPI